MRWPDWEKGHRFNPTSPFYEGISAISAALVSLEALVHPSNPCNFKGGDKVEIASKAMPDMFVLPYEIFRQYQRGYIKGSSITRELCRVAIISCYEKTKHLNDRSPGFEFFRHIRHGCAHNNRFMFFKKEPQYQGEWRGIAIDNEDKGEKHSLFGQEVLFSFLAPGDVLLLLMDMDWYIEQFCNEK